MTVLKWLVVLTAGGYPFGLALLFFAQRSLIFPIPETARIGCSQRIAPEAAGFPEAREHILTTADGEEVIIWHVPARPGRPVVIYFPGNGDFLAALAGHFRSITAGGTGLVALSYRGYAGSSGGAERIVLWGFSLGSGVAVALAADRPAEKDHPGSTLHIAGGCCRFAVLVCAGSLADAGSVSLRSTDCARPGTAFDHAWRARRYHSDQVWRAIVRAGPPAETFVRFPEAGHNDLANYGAIETARRFIDAARG